jgi:hypothetical protein
VGCVIAKKRREKMKQLALQKKDNVTFPKNKNLIQTPLNAKTIVPHLNKKPSSTTYTTWSTFCADVQFFMSITKM